MPFSLIGTLGLDVSPYESALTKVERANLQLQAKTSEAFRNDSMNPFLAHAAKASSAGEVAAKSFAQKFKDSLGGLLNGQGLAALFSGGGIGSALLGAGAGALGGSGAFLFANKIAKEYQSEVKNATIGSMRTGLGIEQFQQVAKTVEMMGSTVSDFSTATDRLAKAQRDIREGAEENGPETPGATKSLKALAVFGISEEEAKTKNFRDLLFDIGRAFQYAEKPTAEMIAALRDLRIPTDLIPAFEKGFDSARAAAGNITEEEAAREKGYKKATETADAFWAHVTHGAKEAVNGIMRGLGIAGIAGFEFGQMGLGFDPQGERRQKSQLKDKEKELFERKKAKTEQEAADRQQERNDDATLKYFDDLEKADTEQVMKEVEIAEKKNQREQRQLDLKKLSPTDRKARLQKELTDIDAQLATMSSEKIDLGDKNAVAHWLQRMAEKQGDRLDIVKEIDAIPKLSAVSERPLAGSLAQIGGFGFGADQGMRQEVAKQTGILERIEKNTKMQFRYPLH
jgi:hypothetical protein